MFQNLQTVLGQLWVTSCQPQCCAYLALESVRAGWARWRASSTSLGSRYPWKAVCGQSLTTESFRSENSLPHTCIAVPRHKIYETTDPPQEFPAISGPHARPLISRSGIRQHLGISGSASKMMGCERPYGGIQCPILAINGGKKPNPSNHNMCWAGCAWLREVINENTKVLHNIHIYRNNIWRLFSLGQSRAWLKTNVRIRGCNLRTCSIRLVIPWIGLTTIPVWLSSNKLESSVISRASLSILVAFHTARKSLIAL